MLVDDSQVSITSEEKATWAPAHVVGTEKGLPQGGSLRVQCPTLSWASCHNNPHGLQSFQVIFLKNVKTKEQLKLHIQLPDSHSRGARHGSLQGTK